jgi:hypothetical protein
MHRLECDSPCDITFSPGFMPGSAVQMWQV